MQKKVLLPLGGIGVIVLAAVGYWLLVPRGEPVPDPPIPEHIETYETPLSDLIHKGRLEVLDSKNLADPWLELGMVYMANMDQTLAMECFEQSVKLDSECARCWYYIAQLRHTTSDYSGAIDSMRRVIENRSNFAPAYWRLGFWQLELGKLEEGEAMFQLAVQKSPRDPAGWFGLAMVRMSQRRESEAAAILEDLLDWTPINRYHANLLLGTVYRRLGRIEEAKRLLMGSEGPPLKWPDAWTNDVSRYFRSDTWKIDQPLQLMSNGRIDEAIIILKRLLRDEPENIDLLNNLAIAYRGLGRFNESNATFRRVIELKEHHYLAFSNLGRNYLIMSQQVSDPQARSEFQRLAFEQAHKAIQINPAFSDARGLLAQVHEVQGEFDKALEEYRLAANDPVQGMMWLNSMVTTLVGLDRWSEVADVLYELSYRFVPQPGTLYGLCTALSKTGRYDEARQTVDRYARLWPNDGRVAELRQMIQDAETTPGPQESSNQ
ncbi:MAG: tetratricopeptide repeat protein [Planctomycetota bacterium]|nr:tetratricopeptide repeat protein [Planctomycetota bacterium]